jgi:8-oxo-dGTP diphosphatase
MSSHPDKRKAKFIDPVPTADIILRKPENDRELLIEKRGRSPFKGKYSLPGGHVDYGETVEDAVLRELNEECNARARLITILGVYSDPKRDPRGQRITTVFIGDFIDGKVHAGDDAGFVSWMDLNDLLNMKASIAFDHQLILKDYHKWLKVLRSSDTFWSSKPR